MVRQRLQRLFTSSCCVTIPTLHVNYRKDYLTHTSTNEFEKRALQRAQTYVSSVTITLQRHYCEN
eukprot:8396-Heterococcus_DN1.PRE.3